MSDIANLIWALAALGVVGLAIALVAWMMKRDATTAGEQASDKTESIDDDTREAIQNAPTKPDADTAHDADDRVRDLADATGTDAGDGFQPKPVRDSDSHDLLPVTWPDDTDD